MIVFTIHVRISLGEQVLIEIIQTGEMRDRNQEVPSRITNLVFNISFFPAGFRIHEPAAESIVFTEAQELVSQFPATVFQDFGDNG